MKTNDSSANLDRSTPSVSSALLDINDPLAIQLCKATKTHESWLEVVRFGLQTLLDDQPVLIECVFLEAERERERKNSKQSIGVQAWEILEELGLKVANGDDV